MNSYLIVGAGITGITLAEQLSKRNHKVLLIDARGHIGGNCFDLFDKNGNYIQRYGPHIFHTKNESVWKYIKSFTNFIEYKHKVLVKVREQDLSLPISFYTIDQIYSKEKATLIKNELIKKYSLNTKIAILSIMNEQNLILKEFVDYIYKNIYLPYTMKQWDLNPIEIDKEVTERVPIYIGYNELYFPNQYQGIPEKGFTHLFRNMLRNKNITIKLNTNYIDYNSKHNFTQIFYTGRIDSYFNYKYGKLKYRNVQMKFELKNTESFQNNSVINYPLVKKYTRVTEFNKFLNIFNRNTVIGREYPSWGEGFNAWPLQTAANKRLYDKYKNEAMKLKDTIFIGRLAECKYFDMDQSIENTFEVLENAKS